ncbi:hypothetical protein ACFQZS_03480 [Mucilaginibacter calamicampi]|uniref:Uncharacterized protein n=1 Tax=Mucilaginibacter calamicampi TaxID=1302352 RepID=A0ABW2YTY6_9SPHI
MFYLFFALFMAFASPSHHTKKNCQDTTVTTQGDTGSDDGDDTGGDGGHTPPD